MKNNKHVLSFFSGKITIITPQWDNCNPLAAFAQKWNLRFIRLMMSSLYRRKRFGGETRGESAQNHVLRMARHSIHMNVFHTENFYLHWNGKLVAPSVWTKATERHRLALCEAGKRVCASLLEIKIWTLCLHNRNSVVNYRVFRSHVLSTIRWKRQPVQYVNYSAYSEIDSKCKWKGHLWRHFNATTEIVYIWWNCG